MREELLSQVLKPARYINHEINSVHKDPSTVVRTWVALAFPDVYEVGMSHVGLKILYKILNDIPHVAAERVYAPWRDYEKILIDRDLSLESLESSRPLSQFDIIGFTLQYELSYTNILNILDLSRIPIKSRDRDKGYPLVIAGGPCAFNPEPLADFIDAFLIGDGEEAVVDIVNLYEEWKAGNDTKDELLKSLSRIEGVYVPSLYSIGYFPDGRIKEIKGPKVNKRLLLNLEDAPFPDNPVLPYPKVIHDRATLEIARGCTRGCRFCQAGIIYRPWREKSMERIVSLAVRSVRNTGYEEVSLSSLNTGDYRNILPLIRKLTERFESKRVSVSLPSLRIGTLTDEIIREIKKIRKTGFTIAPEAGTERLRRVINKDLNEEELERTARWVFDEGWDTLKLYFMIGLPTEREEDLKGIVNAVRKVLKVGKERSRRAPNINVSISAFVPKSHTPFQWKGQISIKEIRSRIDYLKGQLTNGRLKIKGQRPEMSFLEAVFARGDRRLGNIIERAFTLGCRFDGWTECFDFSKWERAFRETGINPEFYANRDFDVRDILPWDFIDTGVKRTFLEAEYKKALREEKSGDCRHDSCLGCGLPCETKDLRQQTADFRLQTSDLRIWTADFRPPTSDFRPKIPIKARFRFSKTGLMRFLSHLDLMIALQRAMARADIPVAFSSGFNPHPKMSFGPALPLGIEGLKEYFDAELISPIDIGNIVDKLNRTLPQGLCIHDAKIISSGTESLSSLISRYLYSFDVSGDEIDFLWDGLAREKIDIERKTEKGQKRIDLRPMIIGLEFMDSREAVITLQDTDESSVKPLEILEVLLNRKPLSFGIRRVGLFGKIGGSWVDPLEVGNGKRI